MKSKSTAGMLALFLGGLGAHKFYLDRPVQGLCYLVFCWTFIPACIALIEAIIYFTMSDAAFNAKYNTGLALPAAQPQNIVVNVQNTAVSDGTTDRVAKLRELIALKEAGHLSPDEFEAEKRRLLSSPR
jgi:TM2 domain-containing membrane protein YozV